MENENQAIEGKVVQFDENVECVGINDMLNESGETIKSDMEVKTQTYERSEKSEMRDMFLEFMNSISKKLDENKCELKNDIKAEMSGVKDELNSVEQSIRDLNEKFEKLEMGMCESINEVKESIKSEVKEELIPLIEKSISESQIQNTAEIKRLREDCVGEIDIVSDSVSRLREQSNQKIETVIEKLSECKMEMRECIVNEVNEKFKDECRTKCRGNSQNFLDICEKRKLSFQNFEKGDPIKFINNLTKVYRETKDSWEDMEFHLVNIITGDAGTWFLLSKKQIANYEQFELAFKKEFCEEKYQRFLLNVLNGNYLKYASREPREYLSEIVSRLLEIGQFSEKFIYQSLIRHFGQRFYKLAISRGIVSLSDFLELLGLFSRYDIIKDLQISSNVDAVFRFNNNPYRNNTNNNVQNREHPNNFNSSKQDQTPHTGQNTQTKTFVNSRQNPYNYPRFEQNRGNEHRTPRRDNQVNHVFKHTNYRTFYSHDPTDRGPNFNNRNYDYENTSLNCEINNSKQSENDTRVIQHGTGQEGYVRATDQEHVGANQKYTVL